MASYRKGKGRKVPKSLPRLDLLNPEERKELYNSNFEEISALRESVYSKLGIFPANTFLPVGMMSSASARSSQSTQQQHKQQQPQQVPQRNGTTSKPHVPQRQQQQQKQHQQRPVVSTSQEEKPKVHHQQKTEFKQQKDGTFPRHGSQASSSVPVESEMECTWARDLAENKNLYNTPVTARPNGFPVSASFSKVTPSGTLGASASVLESDSDSGSSSLTDGESDSSDFEQLCCIIILNRERYT